MKHYRQLIRYNYDWAKWRNYRRCLSITKANVFFIHIMLEQFGNTYRSECAAKHFVANHFNKTDHFWNEIGNTSDAKLRCICQKGYNGQFYLLGYSCNKFLIWLKKNARKMIDEYNSDPRNIWNNAKVDEIRNKFSKFHGIGRALSRMATNQLVKRYSVAGGKRVKNHLFLKPDIQLKRVMSRIGFIENENEIEVLKAERDMKESGILRSPADFDAAIWVIGNEYCHKQNPKCKNCPINYVCDRYANAG